MEQARLYKFTDEAGRPIHGGAGQWFLPSGKRPGKWMPSVADPQACVRGYHLCTGDHLSQWAGPALWVAEGRGKCDASEADKLCFQQARLVRRVEGWNERTQRLFACDCAERVVRLCGDDPRPAEAIRVSRLYADGQATAAELAAARASARDAAWAASLAVAWAAVGAAAGDAALDAERAWQTQHLLKLIGEA